MTGLSAFFLSLGINTPNGKIGQLEIGFLLFFQRGR